MVDGSSNTKKVNFTPDETETPAPRLSKVRFGGSVEEAFPVKKNVIDLPQRYDYDDDDDEEEEDPNSPMNDESQGSGSHTSSSNTTPSKSIAKHLRANLMQTHTDRDPLFYYDIVSVLGVGSMGSVAKVRKKESIRGGSARKEVAIHFAREKKFKACFDIPLIGGWFRLCLDPLSKGSDRQASSTSREPGSGSLDSGAIPTVTSSTMTVKPLLGRNSSIDSSIIYPDATKMEDYNDLHGEQTDLDMNNAAPIFAMKSIHLSRVTDPDFVEELKNEIDILKNLDHPHIVRPIETFDYKHQIFIVMELCCGGDLYARDPYTEAEAARIATSILSAVSFMHSKHISHRDLKYENILFANTSLQAEIKLIDFGLSKRFGQAPDMTEGVGTM
jgi:serine/threonine protein kinase